MTSSRGSRTGESLRERMSGTVLGAGDAGYDEARMVWNARFDARACADARASISYDARIAGRLVDASGRGLPGVTLDLLTQAPTRFRFPLRTVTSPDGSFEFEGVPTGRFVGGMHTDRHRWGPLLPVVFHPGVTEAGRGTRIHLGRGKRTALPDFVLPDTLRPIGLTGVVTRNGGTAAAGVLVYLSRDRRHPTSRSASRSGPMRRAGSASRCSTACSIESLRKSLTAW